VSRRTDFTKALTYTGQKLKGISRIERKIDGVRLLHREGKIVTRNNKVPPGLEKFVTPEGLNKIRHFGDCELYRRGCNFHFINGNLNKHNPEMLVGTADVFPLNYHPEGADPRLTLAMIRDLGKEEADQLMEGAVSKGYEGLIIRNNGRWYRHKPTLTADVRVTGWFEQKDVKGNLKGQLGGFDTAYGKVTAFTEALRKELWVNPQQHVGKLMQVSYKELYETGKFRYAVKFMHFRTDKDEEAFDTKAL